MTTEQQIARAQRPQVGDVFRRGVHFITVLHVGEHGVTTESDSGITLTYPVGEYESAAKRTVMDFNVKFLPANSPDAPDFQI